MKAEDDNDDYDDDANEDGYDEEYGEDDLEPEVDPAIAAIEEDEKQELLRQDSSKAESELLHEVATQQ